MVRRYTAAEKMAAKLKRRKIKLRTKRKFRSNPENRAHENKLQRERRLKRKIQNQQQINVTMPVSKQSRVDAHLESSDAPFIVSKLSSSDAGPSRLVEASMDSSNVPNFFSDDASESSNATSLVSTTLPSASRLETAELPSLINDRFPFESFDGMPSFLRSMDQVTDPSILRRYHALNAEQMDIVQHLAHHLRDPSAPPIRWFIQGAAGTGKSHLVSALETMAQFILDRPSDDPRIPDEYPIVRKMAYTGKAAVNIGGMTLHTSLGLKIMSDNLDPLSETKLDEYKKQFRNCRVVLVDEISLVGVATLQSVDLRLQQFKENPLPFGGLHVIFCGDLRQLPPVQDTPLYRSSVLVDTFQFFELKETMRQREDLEYAALLDRMAENTLTERDVAFLNRRCIPFEQIVSEKISVPMLFHTNEEVRRYNALRLEAIESERVVCTAIDTVVGNVVQRGECCEYSSSSLLQRRDLPYTIDLKLGARYMVTRNLDFRRGIVNGSIGVLRKIDRSSSDDDLVVVQRVWLEMLDDEDDEWTPLERIERTVLKEGSLKIKRLQIPMVLAEAMTIHKSQGSTFDEIVVGTSDKGMSSTLMYVACSRVKNGNGLYLLNPYKIPRSTNRAMRKTLDRLRRKNAVVPTFRFLRERVDKSLLQILFHDTFLETYYEDVLADRGFMNSDVLILRSSTTTGRCFTFPGFVTLPGTETVSIYIRDGLKATLEKKKDGIVIRVEEDRCIHVLEEEVDETTVEGEGVWIVCGKKKWDLYLDTQRRRYYNRTTTDTLFSNMCRLDGWGVYECTYSHHLPLYARVCL